DYVAGSPRPSIMVMEDLDGEHVGYGAFWGEVQSSVHKAHGCLGVVTNGSIRDIPMIAPGFQMLAGSIVPSHAYVHVVDFGIDVNVHGMAVKSGDLVHSDRHGAVVVPIDKIDAMKTALDGLAAREAKIIAAAKAGGDVAAIKAAMKSWDGGGPAGHPQTGSERNQSGLQQPQTEARDLPNQSRQRVRDVGPRRPARHHLGEYARARQARRRDGFRGAGAGRALARLRRRHQSARPRLRGLHLGR